MLRELDAAVRKLLSIEAHLEGCGRAAAGEIARWSDAEHSLVYDVKGCRDRPIAMAKSAVMFDALAEGMTEDRDHRAAVERARDGEEVGDVWRVAQPPWKVADRLVRLLSLIHI